MEAMMGDPSEGAFEAAVEWGRRVEAEYRSAALTAQLSHWLLQLSVSPDLVREGLRIVDDELAHAADALAVVREARRFAEAPPPPPIQRESLGYERTWEPLELDVLAACLETFCLGETVAVPLFRGLRAEARVGVARSALDRVLVDEVRHRNFGWILLEHLLDGPQGKLCRDFATAMLPGMLTRLIQSYASLADQTDLPPSIRAWGMMPGRDYAMALAIASRRDYRPRLDGLGMLEPVEPMLDAIERFDSL
jgi:hypothetical protein